MAKHPATIVMNGQSLSSLALRRAFAMDRMANGARTKHVATISAAGQYLAQRKTCQRLRTEAPNVRRIDILVCQRNCSAAQAKWGAQPANHSNAGMTVPATKQAAARSRPPFGALAVKIANAARGNGKVTG